MLCIVSFAEFVLWMTLSYHQIPFVLNICEIYEVIHIFYKSCGGHFNNNSNNNVFIC